MNHWQGEGEMNPYLIDYESNKIPYKYGNERLKGIPLFEPGSIGQNGGACFHPISIVQYALAHCNVYLKTHNDISRAELLTCSRFLSANYTENIESRHALWWYNFPLKFPRIEGAWYSGMAQGQILSLLVRAHQITGDQDFLKTAQKAFKSFTLDLKKEGCITNDKNGVFIQELATHPATSILNGALYAFIGIIEFLDYTQHKDAASLINKFEKGIQNRLGKFDTGYWSRYSELIRFNLADIHYHDVHIKQLNYLGERLGNKQFLDMAKRFESYKNKYTWLAKNVRILSLNINRMIRVVGLESILFKPLPK